MLLLSFVREQLHVFILTKEDIGKFYRFRNDTVELVSVKPDHNYICHHKQCKAKGAALATTIRFLQTDKLRAVWSCNLTEL